VVLIDEVRDGWWYEKAKVVVGEAIGEFAAAHNCMLSQVTAPKLQPRFGEKNVKSVRDCI
jgi:hypothetical protein